MKTFTPRAPATLYGFQRRVLCIRAPAVATLKSPRTAAGTSGISGSSNVLSIIPWAIQNKIQFAKIKPVALNDSDRGVIATYDINSNENICSVPAQAALRTYPSCGPALGVPTQVWQQLPWFAQLALILLDELVKGRSSKFADYLAVLPKEVDVPVLWNNDEIQQLQCRYFIEQVQQQQQEWTALAQQLAKHLEPTGLSRQQLFWAFSITRSRAFAAPYAAAPLSVAPKVFLAVQVIAAASFVAQGGGAAIAVELLGAAAAAGVGFMLLQQPKTQQQHVLCPLLDMFNHDGQEQSECELDIWSDAFRVVASRHWAQGQQVFISYGQSSSDVLLQLYGFVETNNVHERYLIRSLPDVLQQHGLEANLRPNSLLREVTFTRQGIPTSAAVALGQVCKQSVPSSISDPTDFVPYASLYGAANSICAAAVRAELQQLSVDAPGDWFLLQASAQLPGKQQELMNLQERLKKGESQLQQLQQQLAAALAEGQQLQRQDVQAEALYSARTEGSTGSGEGDEATGSKVAELQRLIQDAALAVGDLQQQVQQLQQLLADWQSRLASCKLLAVQFRYEKQQLLHSILTQLQA